MSNNNIKNIDKLAKKLASLGGDVEQTLRKSIGREVLKVQAEAKLLCPVDTGDLRQSIKTKVTVTDKTIKGIVYTNSDHAVYVEFGTGKVGERTNRNTNVTVSYKQDKWKANIPEVGVRWVEGQPAKPYLYPALKNNEDKVLENIKEYFRQVIREVARR